MSLRRFTLGVSCLMGLSTALTAQIVPGEIGFQLTGGGRAAGTVCSGFSCRPALLVAKPNITFDVTVRAPRGSPFVVLFGSRGTLCASVTGFSNQLVVPPLFIAAGVISKLDTGVRCFGFKGGFRLTIPGSVGKGARLALQAIAITKDKKQVSRPTFSSAIDLVVL